MSSATATACRAARGAATPLLHTSICTAVLHTPVAAGVGPGPGGIGSAAIFHADISAGRRVIYPALIVNANAVTSISYRAIINSSPICNGSVATHRGAPVKVGAIV